MKELTRAEEDVMQILWKKKNALVKEMMDEFPPPKPAYNTVSTIIRILEQKGFVNHEVEGKFHRYFPIILKKDYTKAFMQRFVKKYFSGSYKNMVSFFTDNKSLSSNELEQLLAELKNRKE